MYKLTITMEDKNTDDMAYVLEYIAEQVKDGFTSGHQVNGDHHYNYTIEQTGE